MGHLVGKDVYRKLGKKIDGMTTRAPWNETLYAILKELYTTEEADLIVRMPYGLANLEQIANVTNYEPAKLKRLLEGLSAKGLVMDIWIGKGYQYLISPMIIGIFEFTMMRTRGELNTREWAKLFHTYLDDGRTFFAANAGKHHKVSPLRTLPHEEALEDSEYVEILDYEKASAIIEETDRFAIGICSCRHEKFHLGEKKCDVPLETCSTFGGATEYMIRHGFAREVSREEMRENLARSRELGLVLCADNVKQDISFICHCCGCCCNVLLGVSKLGFPNAIVTSTFIAECDEDTCLECGTCAEQCPINAIELSDEGGPHIDATACLGCGVCALDCQSGALRLVKRQQRVLHPENTFERVLLQCLERGTLQNLLFSDPGRLTDKFLRGLVGGFLRLPPVKRALMSDSLRSTFLSVMNRRAS